MANILLMGWDLLHGNVLLHGWHMSDVSFYPTELVQYALLESVLGLHMTTAHVAAAMTYTLVVLLVVLLARGAASGPQALIRMLIAGGIMIAPQLSAGVYAVDLAVGHIGSSVPLLLGWLLLDRVRGRWIPVLITVLLAWVLVADPVVEITGIVPLALVAGLRFAWQLAFRRPDWYAAALACAAVAAYALAWLAQALLRALGGYIVSPLPVHFRTLAELPAAAPALWRVLDLFGADFHGMRNKALLFLAVAHLLSVALVIVALARCIRRGIPLVDQALAVGIVLNLALYLGTLASTQGAHEIAIALPYAAALAGRTLAPSPHSKAQSSALKGSALKGSDDIGSPTERHASKHSPAVHSPAKDSLAKHGAPRRGPAKHGAAKHGAPTRGAAKNAAAAGKAGIAGRACAVAGVLALCGYLAGFGYELTFPSSPPANSALGSWLLAHGFRSGLATYWEASSVTVDTGDRVTVRAVTGALSPYWWMTDTTWYNPGLATPDFLILQHPSRQELNVLRTRLGPPVGRYLVDGYTILTWHRNLLRRMG